MEIQPGCFECQYAHKFSPKRNTCYCALLDTRLNCKGICLVFDNTGTLTEIGLEIGEVK